MAVFTSKVEGTFSPSDLETLIQQVNSLPSPHFGRYVSYTDRDRRQFKGIVTITVEELPPLPEPTPTPTDADATD